MEEKGLLWAITVRIASDQTIPHEFIRLGGPFEDLAAIIEVPGVGDGTEGDESPKGERFSEKSIGDELGVELPELLHGGASLEKRVESLVGGGLESGEDFGLKLWEDRTSGGSSAGTSRYFLDVACCRMHLKQGS